MAELSTGTHSRTGTQAFPADPRDLYRVRRLIRQEAEQALLPGETIDDLVIAVSEACANAALHSQSPEITLGWDMSEHRIEIRVEDEGVFDKRIPTGLDGSEGGRGIPVMMALMDELSIREGRPDAPGTPDARCTRVRGRRDGAPRARRGRRAGRGVLGRRRARHRDHHQTAPMSEGAARGR